ncbi:MAG: hypothetical protein ABL984_06670 [Pyrinomonadaceae bacterium]
MHDEPINNADRLIIQSLAKLDVLALGIAIGTLAGLTIFLATNFLLYKGQDGTDEIGPNLALLGQYFIGYEVSTRGSVMGLVYGFIFGFVFGSLIALLRNSVVGMYLHFLRLKSSVSAVNDFIDNP